MTHMIRWLHRIEDAVLITLLLAMVLLAGLDILARTLFGGGIGWIPPLLRVMVLWLGLLGALLATRTREHIAIDLINRLGATWLQRLCHVVTSLFAAAVCAIIAWHSQEYIQLAYEFGDQAFARLPAWPMQLVIPFSFAMMALRFLLQAGQSLHAAETNA